MALQAKEHIAEMKNRLIAVLRSVSDSFKSKKALIDTKDAAKNCGGALKNACLYTAKAVKAALTGQRQAVSSLTSPVARMRNAIKGGFKKMGGGLVRFGKGIANPFIKMARAPRLVAGGFRSGGFKGGMRVFFHGLHNNRSFFTTILNYTAPVVGIMILVNVVSASADVTYALQITNDGDLVGYVEDESVFTNAQEQLRQRIIRTDGTEATFEIKPSISLVQVNRNLVSGVDKMTDSLIRMSKADVSEAEGLYIDGDFYGAVTDKTLLETILTKTLDSYRTGEEGEVVSFVKDIQLREGLYLTDSLISSEEMENILLSNQQAEVTYTIVEGDSPILIADKNGIPYSELKSLNPEIETTCLIGQKAIIATEKPFLSVKVVKNEVYDETIPYSKETTEDSSQYKGYTKTVQSGKNGSQIVTASVEYVDGYEVSREVLSTVVTEEPVTEKVVVGTKAKPTYRTGTVLSASTGTGSIGSNFIWPVNTGYVSCGYSYGHKALDIATSYGTPVHASAAGKVIVAGWYYNYGKCVVIDHGNGVQTLYAHNSSLNVSVGDYVSQGQQIAGVGSTGYSTGNHCHFEVKINGRNQNPWNYLG